MSRHAPPDRDRTAAIVPPCFFAAAVVFFTAGLAGMPLVVGELRAHFYQAHVLALTHMLTLGWISMTMCGVLYRYVPGLTKQPVPFPRVARAQLVTFVAGVAALVSQLWLGHWSGTAGAAGLLLVSALLLCANLWPLVLRATGRGVAEVGILLATTFFVAAAVLGTLLALDKERPLLGGSTLTNLSAHAHLAALGWVGVTMCALSMRFLPAFLLPTLDLTGAARTQVSALALAVVLLVAALLARSRALPLAALAAGGTLVAHLVLVGRLVRTHRMPIDWTARHALASAGWLAAALAGGLGLVATGADEPAGAGLAAAYGVAGILGWMSNLVIGMSYKLFPGFVTAARAARGRRAVPVATLAVPGRAQAVVFAVFNLAVAATAAGLVAASDAAAMLGAVGLAGAGLVYGGATARTLAFALVDPRGPADPLAVLP